MPEEQLERSILERKERDELHAIASSMSLKPTARSKKSDIIDLILRATGVEFETTSTSTGATNGNGSKTPNSMRDEDESEASSAVRRAPRTSIEPDADRTEERYGRESALVREHEGEDGMEDRLGAPRAFHHDADASGLEEDSDASTDGMSANGVSSSREGDEHTGTARSGDNRYGDGAQRRGPNNGQPRENRTPGGTQVDVGNRRSRRRRGRERGDMPQGSETTFQGELVPVKGLLDLREEGYGFLRTSGYLASNRDVYVSVSQARRFALRRGDAIEGACRPAGPSEKYPALIRIDTICGLTPDEARNRPRFEDLTALFPDTRLRLELEDTPTNYTERIVDLISPIGKGQRGMIVSPPKAGKTTVLKQIAHSIESNSPDVHLMVLLVDERPEEVTDMRRSVHGEVIASTFDRPADEHTAVAELTIERAKRLVELGRDVVIILDGITRLARAYNLAQPATGRIMSGGVDSGALYPPKKFFGAARNIEEGGSLTILATALVDTGSRMDEVIFEEFKGTGNMELRLDRKLAERRIYPAIDVNASSTRHEELLFDRSQLQQVWKLRRVLNALGSEGNAAAGLELLIDKIRSTKSNDEFLADIAKAPVPTT
jgi:transcription termination factor Rho